MIAQEAAKEYLKSIQRHYLTKRYGLNFENKIKKYDTQEFYDFIEKGLQDKIDLTEDTKYELEAQLKNLLYDTTFLNTEYESPGEWFILSTLFENIKKIFPTETALPYFGIISSGEINAEAYFIKDLAVKLILLEGELLTCGNLLCKILAQSIPLTNDYSFSFSCQKADVYEHLNNQITTDRFNDFFYNSTKHHPSKSKQYFLGKDSLEHLTQLLLDSLEYFVIGHEYGHIYLNHFDSGELKSISLNETNKDLLKISLSWEQEFQADIIGAQIIIAMDKEGKKFPFSILGPDILFNFYHFKNIFSNDEESKLRQESDTHPAPFERKKLVREYVLSQYSQKDKEILFHTYKLVDEIFEYHIENYKKYNAENV
jgi:hypothetical protein